MLSAKARVEEQEAAMPDVVPGGRIELPTKGL